MAAITIRSGLGRNLTPAEVDANFTNLNTENAAQQTTLNSRAPIDSPTFTGAPAAPTPATDDATTRIATTAWFSAQASNDLPEDNGTTASAGTSSKWARADHVHVGGSGSGSVQNALTPASTTDAPSVDAVVAALATKASTDSLDSLQTSTNASLATKFDSASVASQATAEAGTDNTKLLTPLRGLQLIAAKVPTLLGSTSEIMAQSQLQLVLPAATGSTAVTTLGASITAIDSSTNVAAAAVDNSFKRVLYRTAASALNRAAGALTGNGNVRITGPGTETTLIIGFADANFADGSIFGGIYEGTSTPGWTNTQPSAITPAFIGVGCDQGDTTWQVMWKANTGSVTKVDTGFPRSRHAPIMIYIRPNDDASQVFVRAMRLSGSSGRETTATPSRFEYTITTNLYTAGNYGRAWVRSTLAGVGADSATAFQADLLFGGCYGGRVPVVNYAQVDPDPVPDNRTVTGATTIVGTDIGAVLNFNSATTAALTLPNDATLGFGEITAPLQVFIKGVGVPTVTAGSGVTILGTPPTGLAQNKFLVLAPTGEANTWAYI